MDEYAMEYANAASFSNYIEDVSMTGTRMNGTVDMKSISYFAPSLRRMKSVISLRDADVKGPVKDMSVSGLELLSVASRLSSTPSILPSLKLKS